MTLSNPRLIPTCLTPEAFLERLRRLGLESLGRTVTVVKKMVRLVLFDIDGTLIRTGGAGVKAFARVAEHLYGYAAGAADLRFHGATDTGLVRDFLRARGLTDTPQERRRFLEAYLFWLDHHLSLSRGEICPGVGECLAALRRLVHPPLIGLLTGNIRLGAELKLRAHDLWGEFAVGGFGDDHEDRAEIARAARRRGAAQLGSALADDEVLVIGDTPADIACARAIRARCLAVATGGIDIATLLQARPDWAVSHLRANQMADYCT